MGGNRSCTLWWLIDGKLRSEKSTGFGVLKEADVIFAGRELLDGPAPDDEGSVLLFSDCRVSVVP